MYLTIDTIQSSLKLDRNTVHVTCQTRNVHGQHVTFTVEITPDTVRVLASIDSDISIARVLVSPDLIDATRRLYILVG